MALKISGFSRVVAILQCAVAKSRRDRISTRTYIWRHFFPRVSLCACASVSSIETVMDGSGDSGKDSGPQYLLLYRVHNRTCILLCEYNIRAGQVPLIIAYAQDAPYLYLLRTSGLQFI